MKSIKDNFFKQTVILFFVIILSKGFGFFRDIYVGSVLGTSLVADAYNISVLIPNTFAILVQQVISIAFIPIFISIYKNKGQKNSNDFVNKLIVIIGALLFLFSVFIFFASDLLVPIFASGMDNETKSIASSLLKLTSWNLILQTFVIIFSARLNALKKFILPACTGFCFDVVCVVVMTVYKTRLDYRLLGLIPILTLIVQIILLLPSTFKSGYRIGRFRKLFNSDIKEILLVSVPALLSVGIYQINLIVDKNVASLITAGGISALTYSQNIMNLFESLVISSAVTILFSRFSENSAMKNFESMQSDYKNSMRFVGLIIIPVSFILFFFSDGIVSILYGRGAFNEDSVRMTSDCLKGYSISIYFIIANAISTRFLYSLKNRRIPIIASAISLIINIALNFYFYKCTDLGLFGLALATSISSFINYLILSFYISINVLKTKIEVNVLFIKYLILAIISVSFGQVMFYALRNTNIYLKNITSIFLIAAIYIVELLLCDKDSRSLLGLIFRKKSNKREISNPEYENTEMNEETPRSTQ